jgi:glycosyltransferase involved in cell wall biosynthesis
MKAPTDMSDLVSVGLPVYNAEATVAVTLGRLMAQDHDTLEVIVSDNASTDNTVEICRDLVGADPRFRIEAHKVNRGWQANFRHVLAEARGPHFMWIGADDWIEPSYVSANVALLNGDPELVGSVSLVRWTEGGMPGAEAPGTEPLVGAIAENIETYLRSARDNSRFYGLYRTNALRQSFPGDNFFGLDLAIMLGTLRFGGHGRVDEVLMWRERTDPATYVTHIDRDARSIGDRILPLRGLNRAIREMELPLTLAARRWLITRNGYEHLRYWSSTGSLYGRAGRRAFRTADVLRRRTVARTG